MDEFETPKMQYRAHTYWIAGKVPTKKQGGEYHYYVVKPGGKKPIKSEDKFSSVIPANQAARAAIDLLTGVLAQPEQLAPATAQNRRGKRG
ncbi:MAG: hypothetical protein KME07_09250 [Pegethrix bostrychoides GSE-TBD4-15B]|jgi:hypothetical protein|uniref:Uncharacterized protein n=1 Tax=Pegethrix bostrychoides GSE-TBD4-15B TaxID=2839662 RepID=A0A951P9N1_9CYAN|nr:hypothetical protein [Pegethrix bostrychoides GSE-TBD4-15B]